MIIAIDPGKDKCGLAVMHEDGKVLERQIVERPDLLDQVLFYVSKFGAAVIVIGHSAFGKAVEKELLMMKIASALFFVPEKNSTREARVRYWKENPPAGLLKIIPTSFRIPPLPVDDYAAVILGERYLNRQQ